MAQDDLKIAETSLTDDGQRLNLKVKVSNPSKRTRHLYAAYRALRYDPATGVLEVQMSDHGLTEPRDYRKAEQPAIFILPQFTSVDARGEAELAISLPRTIVRPSMAKSTSTVMRFESLPIHEATSVKVDVAWNETPFYLDPKRPFENREQLVEWSKGVATSQVARTPVRAGANSDSK